MKTLDQVLEMAETSISEFCVKRHEGNFTHLVVRFNDECTDIIEALTLETTDAYYKNDSYDSVLSVGTGSIPCNCDACLAGDDPKDWAGDEASEIESWYEEQFENLLESKAELLENR